jgi:hypothetical protein
MHQDVYIYQRLGLGTIEMAEHLDSGIVQCRDAHDSDSLDKDIATLWSSMFSRVYEHNFNTVSPKIDEWHRRFVFVIAKIAEEGGGLVPFARHVAANQGIVYPAKEDLKLEFVRNLDTPNGVKDYDEIFDHAKKVVLDIWRMVADAVMKEDQEYLARIDRNVNLDEGTGDAGGMVAWV